MLPLWSGFFSLFIRRTALSSSLGKFQLVSCSILIPVLSLLAGLDQMEIARMPIQPPSKTLCR